MKRTFYEILGVPHDADQAVLDTAYAAAQARVQEAIKLGTAEASMEAQLVKDGYQMLSDPAKRARAIVQAVTHYNNPKVLAEISEDLGEAMVGINVTSIPDKDRLANRGY